VSAFVALDGVSHAYGGRGNGTIAVDGLTLSSSAASSPRWSGLPAAASRP